MEEVDKNKLVSNTIFTSPNINIPVKAPRTLKHMPLNKSLKPPLNALPMHPAKAPQMEGMSLKEKTENQMP